MTLSAVLETSVIAELRQNEREKFVTQPCTPQKRNDQPRVATEEVIVID